MMAMTEPTAALLPVFRSKHQMQILAEVFCGSDALTGSELARRTGIPQQTVAREVARLERAGVLATERVGTAKTIRPASDLPYGTVLRQLLAYAGGVIPMLERALRDNAAIDEVFIFGSWADRYRGEPGSPPRDVDIAVVSDSLTRFDLAEVRLDLEDASQLAVNMFVFEPGSDRLADLRVGSVPVFARVAA
jgi:predicted nucleotidyltransferase/DNA-binding HxlR family transcriptional regulator